MNSIHVKHLGILLRVHRRHEWLPVIWSQIRELARKRHVHLVVMADRASVDVIGVMAGWERRTPENIKITFIESPGPIRSAQGCFWTETIQFMYQHLREDGVTQAAMTIDDDLIFSDDALLELRAHMDLFEFDRLEADWLQILDEDAKEHDIGFTNHRATCLFRVYKEDDWTDILTRGVVGGGAHAPIFVTRSLRYTTIEGKLLHMGYCSPDRRQEAWNAAKACGQIDGFFRQLARPPQPMRCRGPRETSRTLATHLSQAQRTLRS